MAQTSRPLSPHLGIYRWQTTNALSILHRLTGVMLSAGALALTVWLTSIAAGPAAFARTMAVARSPLGLLFLLGWTFCFFYHFCNGLRHLAWDAGWGFEIPRARATGYTVVVAAIVFTLLSWALAMRAVVS
jgi:succinate dehydrogenase / fumarate reductase cytochrome b subunit